MLTAACSLRLLAATRDVSGSVARSSMALLRVRPSYVALGSLSIRLPRGNALAPRPPAVSSHVPVGVRPFSTTPRREALPAVAAIVGLLKSTSALSAVTVVGRIAYTLVPGSLFSLVRRTRRMRRAEAAGRPVTTAPPTYGVLVGLISLPFVLMAGLWLVALERTPITGRIRAMRLSPEEEAELTRAVLGDEAEAIEQGGERSARAWIGILRRVLEQDTAPAGTLFGHGFLPQDDWRTQFAEAILRVLETGVPRLGDEGFVARVGDLRVPPVERPLRPRDSPGFETLGDDSSKLERPAYQVLVLDSPDNNAFAIGFGATMDARGGRGVIVIFRGFLDALFGQATTVPAQATPYLFGAFSALAPTRPARPVVIPPEPTPQQAQALAVVLSHELSHIVCSHMLETYSRTQLMPHTRRLIVDCLRTLIWPWPFVNDWFNEVLSTELDISCADVHKICSACESYTHEREADAVGLRLLANVGLDPHIAAQFWQERLDAQDTSPQHSLTQIPPGVAAGLRMHSSPEAAHRTFERTHPIDEHRLRDIRRTLSTWANYTDAGSA